MLLLQTEGWAQNNNVAALGRKGLLDGRKRRDQYSGRFAASVATGFAGLVASAIRAWTTTGEYE